MPRGFMVRYACKANGEPNYIKSRDSFSGGGAHPRPPPAPPTRAAHPRTPPAPPTPARHPRRPPPPATRAAHPRPPPAPPTPARHARRPPPPATRAAHPRPPPAHSTPPTPTPPSHPPTHTPSQPHADPPTRARSRGATTASSPRSPSACCTRAATSATGWAEHTYYDIPCTGLPCYTPLGVAARSLRRLLRPALQRLDSLYPLHTPRRAVRIPPRHPVPASPRHPSQVEKLKRRAARETKGMGDQAEEEPRSSAHRATKADRGGGGGGGGGGAAREEPSRPWRDPTSEDWFEDSRACGRAGGGAGGGAGSRVSRWLRRRVYGQR